MTTILSEHRPNPGMLFSDAHVHSLGERWHRSPLMGPASGERMFGGVLKTFEVVGVGGAMSYLNARHAKPGRNAYEFMGVPADLALGLLFSGFALTGYFGQQGDHALNVGVGFLSAYSCRMGSIWGAGARAAAPPVVGVLPAPMPYAPAAMPGAASATQPAAYPWAA